MIFLNKKSDVDWGKEVHGLPKNVKSFILYGNEDCPQRIEWFDKKNPKHDEEGVTITYYE